jgi:hypothetical protein
MLLRRVTGEGQQYLKRLMQQLFIIYIFIFIIFIIFIFTFYYC